MLDRSRGLALGSELVTNGDFSSGTGWTLGTGWAVSGGQATFTATGANSALTTVATAAAVSGRTYEIRYTVVSNTLNAGTLRLGAFSSGSYSSAVQTLPSTVGNQIFRFQSVPSGAGTVLDFWVTSTATSGSITIDNISVKELAGNHAVQATSANRPIYGIHPVGGRRNLLVRTEEFDSVSWTKVNLTATANAGTAPDGTVTADRLVETTATNAFHQTLQPSSGATATTHTVSAYAKAAERNGVTLLMDDGAGVNFAFAQFNLSAGTAGTIQYAGTGYSGGVTSIQDVGNGWYRCSVTASRASAYTARGYVEINDGATRQYTGNTSSGILVWGAQLETGSTATAYQRVTDQYNVTEAGVSSVSYLFFDGVNDSLATPTITPGVDKAQVFAGVRKLSDAGLGSVAELSDIVTRSGAFGFSAPQSAGGSNYSFGSTGSLGNITRATSGAIFAPPITNVVTGIGDIAGDNALLRVNGTQVAQSTADQGTGNYLAYPLYIGGRAGTSLFFSGHLYSLIARFGANLTAAQIADTETWVAGKTGFFTPVISGVPTVGVS
jgi:hypothetical protein